MSISVASYFENPCPPIYPYLLIPDLVPIFPDLLIPEVELPPNYFQHIYPA
jgi:hypothetical protein